MWAVFSLEFIARPKFNLKKPNNLNKKDKKELSLVPFVFIRMQSVQFHNQNIFEIP